MRPASNSGVRPVHARAKARTSQPSDVGHRASARGHFVRERLADGATPDRDNERLPGRAAAAFQRHGAGESGRRRGRHRGGSEAGGAGGDDDIIDPRTVADARCTEGFSGGNGGSGDGGRRGQTPWTSRR